jgi:hypothetical protein
MNDIFSFIDKLELIAFFSGYLIVLIFISIIIYNYKSIKWINCLNSILTQSYGIIGLMYLGMKIHQYLPTLIKYPLSTIQLPLDFIHILAYLSFIFLFLPIRIGYKISIIHSAIYLSIVLYYTAQYTFYHNLDYSFIHNILNVFIDSLLLNMTILSLVFIFVQLNQYIRNRFLR